MHFLLILEWIKFFFEKDPTKKAELKQEFISTPAPKYLSRLNTLQYENDGKFLVGKSLTWADIYISNMLVKLEDTVDQGILNGYPHLRKLKEAVFSEPKIKAWVDMRPPE